MAKSALADPPPKETSSLDLYYQERSSKADAISIDDMHTVYCHTHGSITSSNAHVGQAVQHPTSKRLLSKGGNESKRYSNVHRVCAWKL